MAFDGNENHSISLEDAVKLTANYREEQGDDAFLGGYFGKAALTKILDQVGCVGIRIYNAISDSDEPSYVLVGVDSEGEDLTSGELAEFANGCPPFCPKASEVAGTA